MHVVIVYTAATKLDTEFTNESIGLRVYVSYKIGNLREVIESA